jgi:hypothetical protein
MFLSRLNDPAYCVAQAEMARLHASLRRDQAAKASLLKIAGIYLRIAKREEKSGERHNFE